MKLDQRPFDQQYSQQLTDVQALLSALYDRVQTPRPECACTKLDPCVHHATALTQLSLALFHLNKAIRILTTEDR